MKNSLLLFLVLCFAPFTFYSQAPNLVPYQAVARDAQGHLLANQTVGIRFSIHEVSADGSVVYAETHQATTNAMGLFTLNLGGGSPVSGNFSEVAWGSGAKFLQIELDVANSGNYTDMGTSQMLSVPYALYAERSGYSPPQMNFFFADRDGDGLGDKFSAYYGPYALAQYVSDSTDCNDALPYPQGVFFYFTDQDGDGFGDPGTGFESCSELANGFANNGDDCDSNDPTQPLILYFDNDGDGFGGNQSSIICNNDDPQWVLTGDDCNDNDPGVFPGQFCGGCDQASAAFIAAHQYDILQQGAYCISQQGAFSSEELAICISTFFPEINSSCLTCLSDYVLCTFANCLAECQGDIGFCWECQVASGCTSALSTCIGVIDNDGDGWFAPSDCNDNNPDIHPFSPEFCDGIDTNCDGVLDPAIQYYFDNDGDGYGDFDVSTTSCSPLPGFVEFPGDCNDNDPAVYPGAVDVCDLVDNNCDGMVDENSIQYADLDGDGFGDDFNTIFGCEPVSGYIAFGGDCDDTNSDIYPGATDLCGDGLDSNCDGTDSTILVYVDADGDGYGDIFTSHVQACEAGQGYSLESGDCDDQDPLVFPGNGCDVSSCTGAAQIFTEQNYNSIINEGVNCINSFGFDQQGFVICLTSTFPTMGTGCATCVYDGLSCLFTECEAACQTNQNDCQSCYDSSPCWDTMNACLGIGGGGGGGSVDNDGDGFAGSVDCDDNNASTFPGAAEICDLQDNDCNGMIDDAFTLYFDGDLDGYGDDANSIMVCEPVNGYITTGGDCNDNDSNIFPGNGCDAIGCTGAAQVFTEQNFGVVFNESINCINNLGFDQTAFLACITTTYPAVGNGCATCIYDGLNCLILDCETACQQNQNTCQSCYDASPCWSSMYSCLGMNDPNGGGGSVSDLDNDGLSDNEEASIGTDPSNSDSDNDGLNDFVEVVDIQNPMDSDGDLIYDALDNDDDNDGILSVDEFTTDVSLSDVDADGIPNWLDLDSDNDGSEDATELLNDTNSDSIPDFIQSDIN